MRPSFSVGGIFLRMRLISSSNAAIVMITSCCLAYPIAVTGGIRGGIAALTSAAPYPGSSMIGPFLVVAAGGVMLAACGVAAYPWLRKRRSHWILMAISALLMPVSASVGVRYRWEINAWRPFPHYLVLALLLAALSVAAFRFSEHKISTTRSLGSTSWQGTASGT